MLPGSPRQLFRFCQLDFSFPLGPADGRYLVRGGGEGLDVVVFRSLKAPRPSFSRGRRPKRVEPGSADPDSIPISRVTVIDSTGFDDETAAESWLDRCRKDERERSQVLSRALAVLNRAIHAHRISAADPYERELARGHALAARLGHGTGDELVEGRWRAAYTLPPPSPRVGRRQMLAPQEQLAAILSGRSPVHPSEDLALRARLDLDQGRTRQAAIQLRAAADAYAAEVAAEGEQATSETRERTKDNARKAHALAAAALDGELDEAQVSTLTGLLEEIERPLRRRRHRP